MVIWLVVVNQKTVGKHGHLEAFQLKAIIILYFAPELYRTSLRTTHLLNLIQFDFLYCIYSWMVHKFI